MMAGIKVNIKELHTELWGRAPFPELLTRINSVRDVSFLTKKKKPGVSSVDSSGVYGKNLIADFEFSYGDDFEKTFAFAIPPVFTLKNQVNITETVIVGQQGTVKETASISDWQIEMRGFLINEKYEAISEDGFTYNIIKSEFPQKQLREFRDVYESCKAVKITKGVLFAILGIEKLLIKSVNFDELTGYVGVIPFSATCVSDRDIELVEV